MQTTHMAGFCHVPRHGKDPRQGSFGRENRSNYGWERETGENRKRPPGSDLFSHTVTSAVSSALKRFTSVFGMGTGGSASLEPPEGRITIQYTHRKRGQSTVLCTSREGVFPFRSDSILSLCSTRGQVFSCYAIPGCTDIVCGHFSGKDRN